MGKQRDVGRMAEAVLQMWASEVNIAHNKAGCDRTGWDCLLEFPADTADPSLRIPLDLQPPPIECRVQAKGTDRQRRRCSVSLSNWLRLVRSPTPAFFFVAEFNGKSSPQRAFLVHVDKEHIGRVLKRVRELSSADTPPMLNKHSMLLKYSEGDQLASCDGPALESAIRRHVVPNLEAYVQAKMRLLADVGYEKETGELNMDFVVPESHRQSGIESLLVDVSLGIIPSLTLTGGELVDLRFGSGWIKRQIPSGAKLSAAPKPAVEGSLALRSRAGHREVRIRAWLYAPTASVVRVVSEKHLKFRIATPHVEILLDNAARVCTFKLQQPAPEAPCPLSELSQTADAVMLMADSTHQNWGPIEVVWEADLLGRITPTAHTISADLAEWARTIHRVSKIAAHFDISASAKVPQSEVFQNKLSVNTLYNALAGEVRGYVVSATLSDQVPAVDRDWCVPYLANLTIGEHRIVAALACLGSQNDKLTKGRRLAINLREIRLVSSRRLWRDERLAEPAHNLLNEVALKFQDTHEVVNTWATREDASW